MPDTKTEMSVTEKRPFSDPTIPSGFVALKKPFKITPETNDRTGMVEFVVEGHGKEIDAALREIYENASVGILDFIKALKGFRSSIFALKSRGQNRG